MKLILNDLSTETSEFQIKIIILTYIRYKKRTCKITIKGRNP